MLELAATLSLLTRFLIPTLDTCSLVLKFGLGTGLSTPKDLQQLQPAGPT